MRVALAGRLLGVTTALAACGLWAAFLAGNPYDAAAAPTDLARLLGGTMLVGSAMAAVVAARGAYLGMYLVFFVLFVPVGYYVWRSPGLFSAIGWLELAYLGAAVLVHAEVAKARNP